MANQGFHLNPFEASTLQALIGALGHPGTAGLASSVGLPLIQGAETRRATNIQTRDQGLQQLQQQAMQLAAQGASQDAVQAAVLGQANDLPLMGGPRGQNQLGDLAGYVQGLDWQPTDQGAISGLAPADYRQQFQSTSGLDQADTAAVGQQVITGLQSGTPFTTIREAVRRTAISAGLDEAGVNQAISEAERMYGQAIGMPLDQMRAMGDMLRSQQQQSLASDTGGHWWNPFDNGPQTTFDYSQYGFPAGADFNTNNIQLTLGQLANQPGMLQQLQATLGLQPGR